jgi:hypothetical protein
MSCERFRPALAAHAAGAALEPAAERHLGECAACRQLLDTQARLLAELDAELGRSLSITASPDFTARVVRSTRNAGAPAPRWMPAPVWAGVALAAAIVLAVWIRPAPVSDAGQAVDAGSRPAAPAPAPTEDFRLKAEATHTQGRLTQTQEPAVGPRSTAVGPRSTAVGPRSTAVGPRSTAVGPRSTAVGPGSSDPGRGAPPRSADVEPPVIVEPARALAIARLRELMTEGSLDGKMLPPPVTPEASLAELAIAPLEISELRVPDVAIVSRPPAAPQRQ